MKTVESKPEKKEEEKLMKTADVAKPVKKEEVKIEKKEESTPVSSFTSRLSLGLFNSSTATQPSTQATHPDRRNAVRSPNKN